MRLSIPHGAGKLHLIPVDGEGTSACRRTEKIDGHSPGTGAYVPQHGAGERCKLGKRACPHIALRHLAIRLKIGVSCRQERRCRDIIRAAYADNVEIRNDVLRPAFSHAINPLLALASKMRKHMKRCRPITASAENFGKPRRCRSVLRDDKDPRPRIKLGDKSGMGTAMDRHDLASGHWPAKPRRGKLQARDGRNDLAPLRTQFTDKAGAGAMPHRITCRQKRNRFLGI